MDKEKFAQRFKSLREKIGLTQKELAALLGVKRSTVSSWESAHRWPELEKAQKAAEIFKVSVDYLLCINDDLSQNNIPSFEVVWNEKNLGDAISRIVNICAEFKLSKDIMLEMIDKAVSVYGMPGGEGGIAAHGPNYPGSGALNRNGDDTPR